MPHVVRYPHFDLPASRSLPQPRSRPASIPTIPPLTFPRLESRFAPAPLGLVVGMAIATTVNTSPTFTSPAPTQIRFELAAAPIPASPTPAESHRPTTRPEVDQETLIHVLQSQKVLTPVVEALQQQGIRLSYSRLLNGLTVLPLPNGGLDVRYQHTDPQIAEAVVAQLTQAYTAYSNECRVAACHVLPQVETEAAATAARIKTVQHQLGQVDNPSQDFSLDEQAQWVTMRSLEVESQIIQVQEEAAFTQQRYEEVRSRLVSEGVPDAQFILQRQSAYQALLQDLQALEYEMAVQQMQPDLDTARLQDLVRQHEALTAQLSQWVVYTIQETTSLLYHQSPNQSISLDAVEQSILLAHQLHLFAQRQQALTPIYDLLQRHQADLIVRIRDRDELRQQLAVDQHLLQEYDRQQIQLEQDIEQMTLVWQLVSPPERILG